MALDVYTDLADERTDGSERPSSPSQLAGERKSLRLSFQRDIHKY